MAVQISAYVDESIKEKMEKYSSAHGLKKGFLIQNALDHYLNALYEMPGSMIVPCRMVVSEETMDSLLDAAENEPADTLRSLMRDD